MDAIQASFDFPDLENLIGERSKDALMLKSGRKVKLEFHGTKMTSDAGLLYRLSFCDEELSLAIDEFLSTAYEPQVSLLYL